MMIVGHFQLKLFSCISILFYSILFYSILFYSILFYSILFYFIKDTLINPMDCYTEVSQFMMKNHRIIELQAGKDLSDDQVQPSTQHDHAY